MLKDFFTVKYVIYYHCRWWIRSGNDQVDVILFDFSKAFDRVPHQRLLHKLENYGVWEDTLRWIRPFLSFRKQQVFEKESHQLTQIRCTPRHRPRSTFISCVYQWPPRVDIIRHQSFCRWYAPLQAYKEYARLLQQDLHALQQWESRWQMKFHPEKCQVIRICTNKRYQHETTHRLHCHIFQALDSTKYLGVTISDDMQWKTHIESYYSNP